MGVTYWEARYASGGTSGKGSRGRFAEQKARLVNEAVREHNITSVLDLGCGDGYVAALLEVPEYLGLDPSPSALDAAQWRNPDLRFSTEYDGPRECHLSLDVIRHLVDDDDYHRYMRRLFGARRLVLVWSSDEDAWTAPHDRQREWTPDIPHEWAIESVIVINGINSHFTALVRS